MAAALHAQIGVRRFDQSQSSTPGQTTNGGTDLRYFLSETIQAQESGSRGTHFAKFLISNFHKGLTYSAVLHLDIKTCCIKEGRFINLQKSLHRSPGWPPKTIKTPPCISASVHPCIPDAHLRFPASLHLLHTWRPCFFRPRCLVTSR